MESTTAPAASAPPATVATAVPTVSAERAAADTGDFRAFRDAESASRKGAPLPRVEQAAPTPPPSSSTSSIAAVPEDGTSESPVATPVEQQRQVSKRQQQINDYERTIAELRLQLTQTQRPPVAPPQAPQAPAPPVADHTRYLAMPDAPRLDQFESVEAHSAAMSLFVLRKYNEEQSAHARHEQFTEQRARFIQGRSEKFVASLHDARTADPDFLSKVPPALVTATPLSGCLPDATTGRQVDPTSGKPVSFANYAAEVAFAYSDNAAEFAKYLHAHQDDVVAIARQTPDQWLPQLIRLEGRMSAGLPPTSTAAPVAVTAPAAQASPISAAPPPPPVITRPGGTTDPQAAAFARGDFAEWHRIETQKERTKRGMTA